MSATILDNLLAIVVGTVLLMTLLILQVRQRQSAVDETIHSSVWEHVHEAVELLRNDAANILNRDQADDAFPNPGNTAYAPRFRVDTTAAGFTERLLFPALVQDTLGGAFEEAQVGYRLVVATTSTGDTLVVRLNGEDRIAHRLQRAVLKVADMPSAGTSLPPTSLYQDVTPGVLVDFEVGFVGSPLEPVRDGDAPDGFSAVRIAATGALARLDAISSDQANTRETNGVRITATARPVNL
jgi:hypothetical protein